MYDFNEIIAVKWSNKHFISESVFRHKLIQNIFLIIAVIFFQTPRKIYCHLCLLRKQNQGFGMNSLTQILLAEVTKSDDTTQKGKKHKKENGDCHIRTIKIFIDTSSPGNR